MRAIKKFFIASPLFSLADIESSSKILLKKTTLRKSIGKIEPRNLLPAPDSTFRGVDIFDGRSPDLIGVAFGFLMQ
jgi:hypothetical protein